MIRQVSSRKREKKMFRWGNEKNKMKSVLKLQFHATQVLSLDALLLSVVPKDVSKPTVKLDKAVVHDGRCYWEHPVIKTINYVKDSKTGKISERIHHFVLSTGSWGGHIVGEISIDLANYVEGTRPCSLSLPLKSSIHGVILHVSIQRVQENYDKSLLEEKDDKKTELHEDRLNARFDKSLLADNSSVEAAEELNGDRTSGSETLSSSECSSELSTAPELVMKTRMENALWPTFQEHQRSQSDWSQGFDRISRGDSVNSFRNIITRERSVQDSDVQIEKLRADLASLARKLEVSELELQTLRKQIAKENKKGQDSSNEVINLKEERDSLKMECERLKAYRKRPDKAKSQKGQSEGGDPWAIIEELREELHHDKSLNANLQIQLQKTQESNSELILAIQDLDAMLEQKNVSNQQDEPLSREDIEELESRCQVHENDARNTVEEPVKKQSTNSGEVLEQEITDLYNEVEIYRRDKDELEMQIQQLALDYEILQQENHDLTFRLEQSQLQEKLTMQYECSSSCSSINELEAQMKNMENKLKKQGKDFSDSLASIIELESQIENLQGELKEQREKFSEASVTIGELKIHVKGLEEELEKQSHEYETDLEALEHAKVEQEQRAVRAEEALMTTRWKNINTAKRLEDEFKRLSMKMASTFDANEQLAVKALSEASELRTQKTHLEEMLQKSNAELQSVTEDYEKRLHDLSQEINSKKDEIENKWSEIEAKTEQLEVKKNHREEIHRNLIQKISMLESNIKNLSKESDTLAEQRDQLMGELEQVRASAKETEMMLHRESMERQRLENAVTSATDRLAKSKEELNTLRCIKEKNEAMVEDLKSKLEVQYGELKRSSFDNDLEKSKLKEQLLQVKSELKKKQDSLVSTEKKLKDSNGRAAALNGSNAMQRNNKPVTDARATKEVSFLKDKVKLLEEDIKKREKVLETSKSAFFEKEKDLQNKVQELECKIEELNNSVSESPLLKVPVADQDSRTTASEGMPNLRSNNELLFDSELKGSISNTIDQSRLKELTNEIEQLAERNKLMESELREMQERYSEISLKFAEVEGERQQLEMRLRKLKNARKN